MSMFLKPAGPRIESLRRALVPCSRKCLVYFEVLSFLLFCVQSNNGLGILFSLSCLLGFRWTLVMWVVGVIAWVKAV